MGAGARSYRVESTLGVDPLGGHPGGIVLGILQRVHNLEVSILPIFVHHNLVKVAGVGALEPGALLQILHHVLLHVEGAQRLQGARTPRASKTEISRPILNLRRQYPYSEN